MNKYNSYLKIIKSISLPVNVETHTILLTWNTNLFVLINVVSNKETLVYKLNDSFSFEKITALNFISNTAVICANQMVISGVDGEGKPLILAINSSGKILWRESMEVTPSIWPILGCSEDLYLAWQETADEIKRGTLNLNNKKIVALPSIPVENPPAILHSFSKIILAVISNKNKIIVSNLITDEKLSLDLAQPIAIGLAKDEIFYGWLEGNTACFKFQNKDDRYCVSIKNGTTGKLKAISGVEPTLWLQKQKMTIDEEHQWNSTIIQENAAVFEIAEFIYSVGSWNEMLVVVQNSKLIILKKQLNK